MFYSQELLCFGDEQQNGWFIWMLFGMMFRE